MMIASLAQTQATDDSGGGGGDGCHYPCTVQFAGGRVRQRKTTDEAAEAID